MKVTRIAYSKNLNQGKLDRLSKIASRLGSLRTEIWDRYGSVAGVGLEHRELRDQWLTDKRQFDVPARLWKETLRDTMADIAMYREAAKVIVTEDLTSPIPDKKKYGKNQSRRLSGWVKGTMADALETVSQRRGSSLLVVNAAYTSQMDSRSGALLGQRTGDTFYCFDNDYAAQVVGVVLDADTNAARNILTRSDDSEISLYTPYKQVKAILLRRTAEVQTRLGLLNLDTSCNGYQLALPLSTVSEEPNFYQ